MKIKLAAKERDEVVKVLKDAVADATRSAAHCRDTAKRLAYPKGRPYFVTLADQHDAYAARLTAIAEKLKPTRKGRAQ